MTLIFIIMIIIIICLINKNKNLQNENENHKNNNINFCPNCGFNLKENKNNQILSNNNNNIIIQYNNHTIENKIDNNTINIKKKYTEKEIKNNLILIVGSILIILSAIIFLTSTWNIVHNLVKTIIILLMLLVFLSVSYIADKFLNLKQTSKTFYYIALAYIPIILLSIAMFSLFGKYFSLYGLGRYIYLSISSILVSLIYYYNAKKKDSQLIFIASIIFQLLSVIFTFLIFTTNINIILIGLILYTIIINLLYIKNKIYFNNNIHLKLSTILSISTTIIISSNNLFSMIENNISLISIFSLGLTYINIYLILNLIHSKKNIYNHIYPILIIFIFYNITYLFKKFIIKQLIILLSFIITYIYNLIKEQKINITTYIEIFICFILLINSTINEVFFTNTELNFYINFIIFTILSIINYIFDDKYKNFSAYTTTSSIMISTICLCYELNLSIVMFGLFSLILVICNMTINNIEENLKKSFKYIGILSLGLFTILNLEINLLSILIYLIYSSWCFTYSNKKNDNLYKIISYIYINITLFNLITYLNFDYNYLLYIIPFTTILFTFTEKIINQTTTKTIDNYLLIQHILSLLILNSEHTITKFIFLILINLNIINKYYKNNKNYLYIPFISIIPYIYMSNILVINNINLMYYISIFILISLCLLIYNNKENMYISMLYTYSILHITCIEESKYLSIIILLTGSITCYLIKENEVKDRFKALTYTLFLILYNFIIYDLNLNTNSMFNYGIYILYTLLITRDILKKYNNNYKIFEYLSCILINLITLTNYSSEFDGIIYVIFLTFIVIISYIKKYGPAFITCLISILINVLLLTRTFWLNIPWYIYILIIGSILVSFAIYNEIKDKNNDDNKIKLFKDHLDL